MVIVPWPVSAPARTDTTAPPQGVRLNADVVTPPAPNTTGPFVKSDSDRDRKFRLPYVGIFSSAVCIVIMTVENSPLIPEFAVVISAGLSIFTPKELTAAPLNGYARDIPAGTMISALFSDGISGEPRRINTGDAVGLSIMIAAASH